MNPTIIADVIRYMALIPGAINVVQEAVTAVRQLLEANEPPTDEQLAALAQKIKDNHENLPVPE